MELIFAILVTGQRRLTRTAALETNPVWSPDGRRIAFTSDRHAKRGPVHRRQEHPPAHAQPGPRPPAAAMRPVSANFIGPGT
jgi:hypothetical protein